MTFDEWCEERQIRGVWREALFHHVMASRSADKVDDPKEWAKAWTELMQEYTRNIPDLDGDT